MSWGFFLDLNLTVPTSEWKRLAQTKTADHGIDASWWGFQDEGLARMFSGADFDDETIGEVVASFAREESVGRVDADGETTTIRLAQHLDKSGDTSIAKTIAALFEAAKESANGTLRLLNDGTFSGEDGVEINAGDGELSRTKPKDALKLAMKVGSEIYGGVMDDEDIDEIFEQMEDAGEGDVGDEEQGDEDEGGEEKLAPKKAAAKKPAAKKAAAKKAAAKKPAKKAAAKKPAAKKAAAKPVKKAASKPAAKKAAAKKPAAKKAPAKKAGAKKRR